MKNRFLCTFVIFAFAISSAGQKIPARQMENLSRGVVALNQGDGKVFVGWRMLGTDPDKIAFNLYRSTGGAKPVKLNSAAIADVTFFVDDKVDITKPNAYFVRPVLKKKEHASSNDFILNAN